MSNKHALLCKNMPNLFIDVILIILPTAIGHVSMSNDTGPTGPPIRSSRQLPGITYDYTQLYKPTTPDFTTISYPYLTTPVTPTVRPFIKIQTHPVRRAPHTMMIHHEDDDFFSEEAEDDFVPLLLGNSQRWAMPSNQHYSYAYPPKHSGFGSSSSGASGYAGEGFSGSSAYGGHAVPIIAEIHSKPKFDLHNLGILALVKIGLTKLKAFGALKFIFFLLLKFKLLLILLFVKFVLFLKALKLLKALLLPLILLALAPLLALLLPLLLLPLLLPLLLFAPIPTVIPTANNYAHNSKVLDYIKNKSDDPVWEVINQLVDSEKCIDRIACELATKKESKALSPFVNWYLTKLSKVIRNEKLISYINAYLGASKDYKRELNEIDGQQWCIHRHPCLKLETSESKKTD